MSFLQQLRFSWPDMPCFACLGYGNAVSNALVAAMYIIYSN